MTATETVRMPPLPAHWASRDGLITERVAMRSEWQARWDGMTAPERRASGKKRDRQAATAACRNDAEGVSGCREAAGLVIKGTSHTNPIDRREACRNEVAESLAALGDDIVTIDPVLARLQKMSRRVRGASKLHAAGTDLPPAMFTLTHRAGEKADAKDVSKFINHLRMWALRKHRVKHLRYVWVAELQSGRAVAGDEGAVHYHVAVWMPAELKRRGAAIAAKNPKFRDTGVLPKPDKKGWWKKGSTERAWVRKSVSAYLSKYLSKGSDGGTFPRGLRIHGAGGFAAPERLQRSYTALPAWLRKSTTAEHQWARVKGGWQSKLTGEREASPWECIVQGSVIKLVKRTAENYEAVCRLFRANVALYLAA